MLLAKKKEVKEGLQTTWKLRLRVNAATFQTQRYRFKSRDEPSTINTLLNPAGLLGLYQPRHFSEEEIEANPKRIFRSNIAR